MGKKNPDGFTLVELLVVIGIIAVLATLILSALSRAKAGAQRTTCLNNLRQITLGVRMYADDSADRTPRPDGTSPVALSVRASYKKLMQTYVGQPESSSKTRLFSCPADSFFYTDVLELKTEPEHNQPFADFSSYGFNGGNLIRNPGHLSQHGVDVSRFGIAGKSISAIRHPSKTVLLAENSAFEPFSWHEPKKPLTAQTDARFNNAKNTVSFADGHVSYIKIFWTNTFVSNGTHLPACFIDPPSGYDYQWSDE